MTNPGDELRRKLDDLTQRQQAQQRQAQVNAQQSQHATQVAAQQAEQARIRQGQQAQTDARRLCERLGTLGVDQKLLQIRETIWGGEGELRSGDGIDPTDSAPLAYVALVFEYPDANWVETIPARTHYVSLEGGSVTDAPARGMWMIGHNQLWLMVIARQEADGFRWSRIDVMIHEAKRKLFEKHKQFDPIQLISGHRLGSTQRDDRYNLNSAQAETWIDEELVQYADTVLTTERGPKPVTGDYVSPWHSPQTLKVVGRTHIQDNRATTLLGLIGGTVLALAIVAVAMFLCFGGNRLFASH